LAGRYRGGDDRLGSLRERQQSQHGDKKTGGDLRFPQDANGRGTEHTSTGVGATDDPSHSSCAADDPPDRSGAADDATGASPDGADRHASAPADRA
jgi:hypothetical protein